MKTNKYERIQIDRNTWVVVEGGRDYKHPSKTITFAFDTETQTYFTGKILTPKQLFKKTKDLNTEEKRSCLTNKTWAWQCYDEVNGFFMTNNFQLLLQYQCWAGYKFGWCYNSTFDFAQLDFQILSDPKWSIHLHRKDGFYDKGQKWTYESIHNDMGARYAYKIWVPYRNENRHVYVHATEYRDFMKLITGGLGRLLEDLDVKDNEGVPIRKLTMEYQNVNAQKVMDLTDAEIDYCMNDVKGLYFAVKIFNEVIEQNTDGHLHIFGPSTNVMTAGGMAKFELLRSLYPKLKTKKKCVQRYKKDHPLTIEQDKYFRDNNLYRGGIAFVNPYLKGRMIARTMYRYDVNSEYPFSMASIDDLIGKPFKIPVEEFEQMDPKKKEQYEAIYMLTSVTGDVKEGYLGLWYDPFVKDYVEHINENGLHLMFEREFNEMLNWYDNVEISMEYVILVKKGTKNYAPFVMKNYEQKAQAGLEHNKVKKQFYKLLLNSSYGKLAERIERVKGHYEINNETGAVHFVKDEVEQDDGASMSVLVGSLVTSFARCYILSKIREIHGNNMKEDFMYIDTDSIHTFRQYNNADPVSLGGLKCEAVCDAVKYLAPKTYVDIETIAKDGTIDYNAFEIHSKGINITSIINDLKKKQKGKKNNKITLDLMNNKFNYGKSYIVLVAMNVKGGKVLIPTQKFLARVELRPVGIDTNLIYTNYEGGMFTEL